MDALADAITHDTEAVRFILSAIVLAVSGVLATVFVLAALAIRSSMKGKQ